MIAESRTKFRRQAGRVHPIAAVNSPPPRPSAEAYRADAGAAASQPAGAVPAEGGAAARGAAGALDPRRRPWSCSRGLMTRVTVRPGEGCVDLVVEGALTAMLALGCGARAEAFASCSKSSVKVVAGARLRHCFQNGLRRFAMTKMQAAFRRARITRPSLSWRRSSRLLANSHAQSCSTMQRIEPSPEPCGWPTSRM